MLFKTMSLSYDLAQKKIVVHFQYNFKLKYKVFNPISL